MVGALMAGALALSACAGDPPAEPAASSSGSWSTESVTPSPSPTVDLTASPFSGRPGGADKQVLVVKYDNTTNAQPHVGLRAADIVYIEEVEYGLTRLAAVFATKLPTTVGPVRSARISDIDLLAQFGKPAFAYSGAQKRMYPVLARASIYDVSGDKGGYGYYRDGGRRAPYNFMGKPAQLMERAPKASKARDIGFVFATETPSGGTAIRKVTANYPASQAQFVWDAEEQVFDVRLNGSPAREASGGTQQATTVVIQYVKQYDSGFGDKFGGRTPKEETIGSGKALVLRDGQLWRATWSRPSGTEGTTFTAEDGSVIAFDPGQVWVALVNRTTPAKVQRAPVAATPAASASAS
jgi:hypothetical protein